MALDHLKLELLFNVIAITAVTSLTLIWYLRKRDRETLVNRMSLLRQAAAARVQPAKPQEDPPLALPGVNPDIRQFVSGRATGWMAPSVAQWNQRLTPNGEPSRIKVSNPAVGLEHVVLQGCEPQIFCPADQAGGIPNQPKLKAIVLR